ncbi:uncharacterized protein BDCG_02043 [Blastomyces dermatitidis ER-3]|uniref:Uncharacterized protein n=1 Tax=Ajellomyces dermatitidis (strain ER-3 / ATCC MYA-2586) TaxID=559297 RepID=A0ABP2EWU9_AJEDR|nr:uncharacterized protein BDCG_02043 [Blastomyces dermatitidis ER-3]EEQ86923.1 hypothetical protein BDCG_02043 [Blastomyces dermatitidis ER-3]
MAVTRTTLVKALAIFALLNENFSVAEQLPSWFNGYYIYATNGSTAVESITCRDSHTSWITSGTYANCCATTLTTRCPMPTKCEDASVSFDNGGGYTCPERQSCATMTVYETSPGGSPSATNIFCWENWSAYTVYRKLPAEATDSSTITPPPQTSPPQTSPPQTSPSQTSQPPNLPSNNPQESDPRPSTPPTPAPEKSRSNGALIGGVAAGAVVGVSILALAYFFYRRKQKNGAKALPRAAELDNTQGRAELQSLHTGGGAGQPKAQGYYGYAAGGDGGNPHDVHELLGAAKDPGYGGYGGYGGHGGPPAEMNASRNQNVTYEMPTNPS